MAEKVKIDSQRIEKAVKEILEAVGEDTNRKGVKSTSKYVHGILKKDPRSRAEVLSLMHNA